MTLDFTKPVLLLDIDGVLNSRAWIYGASKSKGSQLEWLRSMIDPELAAKVAALVRDHECSVVVCSSWRIILEPKDLQGLLAEHEIPFHGVTPPSSRNRTGEIRDFVTQFPPRTNWIVLDDSVPEEAFGGRRVVRPRDGLTDLDIARARAILDRRKVKG